MVGLEGTVRPLAWLSIAVLVAACASGARPETSVDIPPAPSLTYPTLGGIQWIDRANPNDFARYYPERARSRRLEGRAVLDCAVGSDGRLTCTVVSEYPSGLGFGEASLRVSRHYRMDAHTAGGVRTEGGRIRLPINFFVSQLDGRQRDPGIRRRA
jgi:TonB family protein